MLHVWYIHLHLPYKLTIHVGKYTIQKERLGSDMFFHLRIDQSDQVTYGERVHIPSHFGTYLKMMFLFRWDMFPGGCIYIYASPPLQGLPFKIKSCFFLYLILNKKYLLHKLIYIIAIIYIIIFSTPQISK